MEQSEIFTTGRHKELNEEKFNSIIKDIQDFAEYAKYNRTAYWRLMNIKTTAKVEWDILNKKRKMNKNE